MLQTALVNTYFIGDVKINKTEKNERKQSFKKYWVRFFF